MRESISPISQIEGVTGAVLVSRDGLVVASTIESEDDEEVAAAMAASIFGTIDNATSRMGLGSAHDTIVETESHAMQIMGIGELILVVITTKGAHAGRVRLEMRRAARQLKEILQGAA